MPASSLGQSLSQVLHLTWLSLILFVVGYVFRLADQLPAICDEIRRGNPDCVWPRVTRAGAPVTLLAMALMASSWKVWKTAYACLFCFCFPSDDRRRLFQILTIATIALAIINVALISKFGSGCKWLGRRIPNLLGLAAVYLSLVSLNVGVDP